MNKIKVKGLWIDRTIGREGFIGALLYPCRLPVALCSMEKWELGEHDSLRKNWQTGDLFEYIIFSKPKIVYCAHTETELRQGGLSMGRQTLTVPDEIKEHCISC
jgi:hypothetical protein